MLQVASMPFYSTQRASILLSRINMISSYFRAHDEHIAQLEDLVSTLVSAAPLELALQHHSCRAARNGSGACGPHHDSAADMVAMP